MPQKVRLQLFFRALSESAYPILGIERRLDIFETKLHLRIADRKDAESVSFTQRNFGESAFARKRRQSLSYRYTAGIRKGFCQIRNIRVNVEHRSHRDSMMTNDLPLSALR
jgi:hypothetical protein